MDKEKEIFKDCLGFDGVYQISNLGNVLSFQKGKKSLLKPNADGWGYLQVIFHKNRKRFAIKVHKLVFESFIGVRPKNMNIDHINNIKTDNRLSNLQLLNTRENVSKAQMQKQKLSEFIGVTWCKLNKKWVSKIYINGTRKSLGYFNEEYNAAEAYYKAVNNLK